jgi:NitT/TauT family transport system substrate-binding protein
MHKAGILDGDKGEQGEFERKHGVDIVLVECAYAACISQYAAGALDAVALTNLDTITTGVRSVGFLPTSTSAGGDQLWAKKEVTKLAQLKGHKVRGLAGSVSEYMFRRNLELEGLEAKDFTWVGEEPEVVTQAMLANNAEYDAGVVWNPFGIAIRKARPDLHALATSAPIAGEIVDMLVMSESSWARAGAQDAARALADAYYDFNRRLGTPERDALLVATGEKFGASTVEDMSIAVTETKFYATAADGLAVWKGAQLAETMPRMVRFVQDAGLVTSEPLVAFGAAPTGAPETQAWLRFDSSVMEAVGGTPATP